MRQISPKDVPYWSEVDIILWEDWDPIGINHESSIRDEYCAYVTQVALTKLDTKSVDAVAILLFRIATEQMGLAGDFPKCQIVAEKIVALGS